jgi:hypothetical protein
MGKHVYKYKCHLLDLIHGQSTKIAKLNTQISENEL